MIIIIPTVHQSLFDLVKICYNISAIKLFDGINRGEKFLENV